MVRAIRPAMIPCHAGFRARDRAVRNTAGKSPSPVVTGYGNGWTGIAWMVK